MKSKDMYITLQNLFSPIFFKFDIKNVYSFGRTFVFVLLLLKVIDIMIIVIYQQANVTVPKEVQVNNLYNGK